MKQTNADLLSIRMFNFNMCENPKSGHVTKIPYRTFHYKIKSLVQNKIHVA